MNDRTLLRDLAVGYGGEQNLAYSPRATSEEICVTYDNGKYSIMNVFLVALGSAAGGVARYLVGTLIPVVGGFPLATLSINILGSLLIGILSGLLARLSGGANAEALRLVLVVGFCGGFTTFSTFSNETFRLIESSHYLAAVGYVLASIIAGLIAVFFGYAISR